MKQKMQTFQLKPNGLPTAVVVAALLVACGGGDEGVVDKALILPRAATPLFTEPAAGVSEYQRHLDTATANAGTEFAGEQRKQWCWSVENTGFPPEFVDRGVVPMTKLFDNLYFGGARWVGQFVLKTPTGYFLLDGLNTEAEAKDITVAGLNAAGIDPTTLKGIMPTHGHGDHFNGAWYMQNTYGGPVYIGSADEAALKVGAPRYTFPSDIITTTLDSSVLTPQTLTVDGLDLTVLSTPGHTAGTFSGILPAKLGKSTYKLIFWGGTGTPTTLPMANQYLDGSERLYKLAKDENVDGTIHTHAFVDGTLAKIDGLATSKPGDKNPFLIGNASTLRTLSVLRECSAAKVNALDTMKINPVWLTTTTEAVASSLKVGPGSRRNVSALVRVNDPYGVVANAQVTLRLSGTTGSCTATTDADGVASCGFIADRPTKGKSVVATFEGLESTSKVWLSSSTSVALK